MDFIIGMKTNAPDMRIMVTRGPSMRGEEVRIKKQSAAQNRVRIIHWVLLSGFFMVLVRYIKGIYRGSHEIPYIYW